LKRRDDALGVLVAKIFSLRKEATQSPRTEQFSLRARSESCRIESIASSMNQRKCCSAGVSCIIEKWRRGIVETSFIAAHRRRATPESKRAALGPSGRQHFLKRGAVFFGLLVYSGGRVSRFPSARSDESHLTSEGTMAKKAKKAKKAKSAVKKTAKKTRKVAKKK
jgi:hypothetical protein